MKKSKYCLEIIETPIECMDCEHKFLCYNKLEICTYKRMDKKIKFMTKCPLRKWCYNGRF